MMDVNMAHGRCQSFVFKAFLLLLLVQQCLMFWMPEKDAKLSPAEKLMFEDERLLVWCNLTGAGENKEPPLQLRIGKQNQLEKRYIFPRNESMISDGNVAVWVDIDEFFFRTSSGPDGNHLECFNNETWITSEPMSVEHRIQEASDFKAVYLYDEDRLEVNWTGVDQTYFKPQMFVTTVDYVWGDDSFIPGKPDESCSSINGASCIFSGLRCSEETSSSCTIQGSNYGSILFVRVNVELKQIWKNKRPDDEYLENKTDVYFASVVKRMETTDIVKLSAPAQFQVNTTNATCIWIQWTLNDFFYSEESVLFQLEARSKEGTVKMIQSQVNITIDANTKPALGEACGLAEFTEYSLRLKVKADEGQGYWSDWTLPRTATTREDYPLHRVKRIENNVVSLGVDEANDTMNDANNKMDDANNTMHDANDTMDDANNKMDDDNNEMGDANNMMEDANYMMEDANTMIDDANKVIDDIKSMMEDANTTMDDANKVIDDIRSRMEDAKNMMDDVKKGIDVIKSMINDVNNMMDDAKKGIDDIKSMMDGAKIMNDVKKEMDDAKEKMDFANNMMNDAKKGIVDVKNKMDDAKNIMDDAKNIMDDAKNKMDDAKKGMDDAKKAMDDAKKGMDDAKKGMDGAKEGMDVAKSMMGDDKSMMDDDKNMNGVYKRMSGDDKRMNGDDKKRMNDAMNRMSVAKKHMDDAKNRMDVARNNIGDGKKVMDDAKNMFGNAKKKMIDANNLIGDAKKELSVVTDEAKKTIGNVKKIIGGAKNKIGDAKKTFDDAKKVISDSINDAKKGVDDAIDVLDSLDVQAPLLNSAPHMTARCLPVMFTCLLMMMGLCG